LYHDPRARASAEKNIFDSSFLFFKAMTHCAWKSCARQPECLCIASEISAKLFFVIKKQGIRRGECPAIAENLQR
jgi:hypothetical protein